MTPPVEAGGAAARLFLAGDVMLGRGIDQIHPRSVDPALHESFVRSARTYVELAEEVSGAIPRGVPPSYVWGDLLPLLGSWDPPARIVNLETAVTAAGDPWPGKGIHYRMHPANVAVLTAAGIDCAVLANNHVLDWGRAGLRETVASLRAAAIGVAGAGLDLSTAAEPVEVAVPGGRVLVFGVAHPGSGVPEAWAAGSGEPGVFLLPSLSASAAAELAARIRTRKRPGDLVVVSIHWGDNWGYDIPAEQELFAHALVEAGAADVVHGHSSHHPRRIEIHRGRLILYGAGDLINDYEGIGGYEAFRPELSLAYFPELAADGRLVSMRLVPLRIERFRLRRATGEDARWLLDLVRRESRGLAVEMGAEGILTARPAP